jgi:hypothetical protein
LACDVKRILSLNLRLPWDSIIQVQPRLNKGRSMAFARGVHLKVSTAEREPIFSTSRKNKRATSSSNRGTRTRSTARSSKGTRSSVRRRQGSVRRGVKKAVAFTRGNPETHPLNPMTRERAHRALCFRGIAFMPSRTGIRVQARMSDHPSVHCRLGENRRRHDLRIR